MELFLLSNLPSPDYEVSQSISPDMLFIVVFHLRINTFPSLCEKQS